MSDTIRRWECVECGRGWDYVPSCHANLGIGDCPGVPVERVYVAIDAIVLDGQISTGGWALLNTHADAEEQP